MRNELLKVISTLDAGNHAYVHGDVFELREELKMFDNFIVAPIGNGQCKVTKLKAEKQSFRGMLADKMKTYDGTPIRIDDTRIDKVRMAVSSYNQQNNSRFSVRAIDDNTSEIHSSHVADYASISKAEFHKFREAKHMEIDAMFKKIRPEEFEPKDTPETMEVDYEDEYQDEEQEQPEPHVPVAPPLMESPKPKYVDVVDEDDHFPLLPKAFRQNEVKDTGTTYCERCGDEFFKQGHSNICADCFKDEDML